MKKRTILTLFACALALTLCACTDTAAPAPEAPQEPTAAEQEKAPKEEPAKEPADTVKASIGPSTVEIGDAILVENWEGKPTLVATITWTNGSEETTSAGSEFTMKAYQDGVELDVTILDDIAGCEADGEMKDIRPGATQTFQYGFEIANDTSPVEVEITDFWEELDGSALKEFDITKL